MAGTANAVQAERWNGESGRHWIAHRERHAAIRHGLTPHLMRAAAIGPGDRVLDVGCGCGETAIAAARAGAEVVGLDLSAPLLDVARRLAVEAGAAGVRFVEADAQTYPLAPEYDVVLSSFGVLFFDDPAAAFANILGALRPGGRLAFLSWQADHRNELFGIPQRAFDAVAPPPQPAGPDLFDDPERIAALLAAAGATGIGVESLTAPARLGSDVPDVLDYLLGMGRYRRLIAEIGDEDAAQRAVAAMAERYAARERPDGVWIEVAAWLARAHVPADR